MFLDGPAIWLFGDHELAANGVLRWPTRSGVADGTGVTVSVDVPWRRRCVDEAKLNRSVPVEAKATGRSGLDGSERRVNIRPR
jgi:hypothetical protein